MNAIAWAIFCASFIMMHPRDRLADTFSANNTVDVTLFTIGFGCLIYFSFRNRV